MTTGVLCCEDLRLGRTLGSFYKSNGVWVDSLPLLLLYLKSFNPFISLTPIIPQKPSQWPPTLPENAAPLVSGTKVKPRASSPPSKTVRFLLRTRHSNHPATNVHPQSPPTSATPRTRTPPTPSSSFPMSWATPLSTLS
jgi:hypothetical protein